jgi:hypothetical protein
MPRKSERVWQPFLRRRIWDFRADLSIMSGFQSTAVLDHSVDATLLDEVMNNQLSESATPSAARNEERTIKIRKDVPIFRELMPHIVRAREMASGSEVWVRTTIHTTDGAGLCR